MTPPTLLRLPLRPRCPRGRGGGGREKGRQVRSGPPLMRREARIQSLANCEKRDPPPPCAVAKCCLGVIFGYIYVLRICKIEK